MALDATVGGEHANSYGTVAEADAYFQDRAYSSTWQNATNKPNLLVTATSLLDWYMDWLGVRATTTQALDWPRSEVMVEGVTLPSDILPTALVTATYELALTTATSDLTENWDLAGIKKTKVGTLEVEVDGSSYNPVPKPLPDRIYKILKELITNTGSGIQIVHLMRA